MSSQTGAELLPLGKFVNECDLQLDWSRAGAHVTTREGRVIELVLKSGLPYFRKRDVEYLQKLRVCQRMACAKRQSLAVPFMHEHSSLRRSSYRSTAGKGT